MRDPETGQNRTIKIVCIRCEQAQAAGDRYLKRLLPRFVIPGCVIRLDAAVKALETAGNLDEACDIMGCLDERTARRHRDFTTAAIARVCLRLAEEISLVPHLTRLPWTLPGTKPIDVLTGLLEAAEGARIQRGGVPAPYRRLSLIQAELGKKAGKKSTGYVSCSSPFSAITAEQEGGP